MRSTLGLWPTGEAAKYESIQAFLLDEQATPVNPFYAPALGGVKLVVRAEDAAREILGLAGA